MENSKWVSNAKLGATVASAAFAFYLYFKDDAVGSVRVDKSVTRASFHFPIIGSLYEMVKDIDSSLLKITDEVNSPNFDKAVVLSMPFAEPTIVVNDPESVEYITNTNFENYIKGSFTKSRMTDVLGNGIFNTDGHDWFIQRKLAARILTNRNFKINIETVFTDNIKIFINVLNDGVAKGENVDVHNLLHRYFMDSFGKIAYGIDLNSLSEGALNYVSSFDRCQNAMGDRFINPFWPITERFNPQLKKDVEIVRGFGNKVVEDRKLNGNNGSGSDLLSLFMDHRNEDGSALSSNELADHVINFILAGRDTTSQALSWTIYCLDQNPTVKAKLIEEIDAVLGDQIIPEYDQIKKMKYANAVFKETLRLYPSVPREGKIAVNADILPNGTKIPKGANLAFSPYAMGRSEKIWENASEYKPERWFDGKNPSNYAYVAFMCGPRICLGKNLAELQGVFTLVALYKNFGFSVIDPSSVQLKMSLTLPMKNGPLVVPSGMQDSWFQTAKACTVIAVAGGIFYWYYKDDAIGSIKVDQSIPRTSFHLPIVGSLFALIRDMDNSIDLISQELNSPDFDKAVVVSVPFSEPRIMIHDPASIEYITNTNFDNYVKGSFTHSRMADVLGRGIFNSDGVHWYMQRKLTAKIMTSRNFKLFIDTVFTDNIEILLAVLSSFACNGTPVDMHDMLLRYFMDSFGKIAYGVDIKSLVEPTPKYVAAFDRTQNTIGNRFINPLFRITDKFKSHLKEDIQMIRDFGNKVVSERKDKKGNSDLLSLFMDHRNEDGSELTTEELADHVISFILAGRDSTTQALCWTLYCLSNNSNVTKKLLQEIDEILGGQLLPTYEQIKQMKYANAVFKETLRLYPSVPREGKVAANDDTLPNGVKVPKGAIVTFYPYAMGRSDKLWEHANEYKPERWLNTKQPSQYKYTAFMCGPRSCLGKALAEIQGVFTLVSILKSFSVTIIDPSLVTKFMSLTLPMKNGLLCQLKKK
ncbi:hypothetical protein HDV01_002069 [Terramyces sp. JEL0728]|nr:hypothetical protein HDV01_002069 [Terramyces sp. JEL0728]